MKLKILPPTLRIKKRYMVLDIISEKAIDKNELVSLIWSSCIGFFGESKTSDFRLWLIKVFPEEKINLINFSLLDSDYYRGDRGYLRFKAILRCQRSYEEDIKVALALLNNYNGNRISIQTIAVSGTIKGAMNYI